MHGLRDLQAQTVPPLRLHVRDFDEACDDKHDQPRQPVAELAPSQYGGCDLYTNRRIDMQGVTVETGDADQIAFPCGPLR